jgi:DNA recombination protein RmuC
MINFLLILIIVLIVLAIILIIFFRPKKNNDSQVLQKSIVEFQSSLSRIETNLREDFRINREENSTIAKENRDELNNTLKEFRAELSGTLKIITEQSQNALKDINKTLDEKITALVTKIDENNKTNRDSLSASLKDFSIEQRTKFDEIKLEQKELTTKTIEQLEKITGKVEEKLTALTEQDKIDNNQMRESLVNAFKGFQETFDKNVKSFNDLQREKFGQLEEKQTKLIESTEKKLEQMRETVDEKLQKTLNDRLSQSFETVGKQLQSVQEGLGEMKNLAQDVGGLKKVLSNVRTRGGVGEVQLEMLLQQILAPEQYEANVKTKKGSNASVEFAIKLPGHDENQTVVYLPIDAKFPKDAYEHLMDAFDTADAKQIESASKGFDNAVKGMAKDICEKYLDPPNTTDFGIMFLPFESIYAEVVRKASLLEDLQRNYKIVVTGPTTLAAILNSLQMGFRTLAIQKRSSEVWQILGAVKKEFENFGGMLQKAQNNIQTGLNQLDDVMGKRTRAIQRKLKGVETLSEEETKLVLPEATNSEVLDEDNE